MPAEVTAFERYRERLDGTPFAVLATHGPLDRLDLVPCCFAVTDVDDDTSELVTAIDHKPKRTTRLARLTNIERNPAVTLLIDHRDPEDWSQLWWLRAHGTASIVTDGSVHRRATDALVAKYRQYQAVRPVGPVIRISVDRWTGWGI